MDAKLHVALADAAGYDGVIMSAWDADHYLRFGAERTRPAVDLVQRIQIDHPRRVVDIGCGPGNSTEVLRARWPEADIVGVDSSREMIAAARQRHPEGEWIEADAATWTSDEPFDVVFSNAALQWLPDHAAIISRLFGLVASGGVLAVQIPSYSRNPVRVHIHDISEDARWSDRMEAARSALTMESPAFYYDVLSPVAAKIDLWETEYSHVMPDAGAIVEWISSTGLRPFLDAVSPDERESFLKMLRERVTESYPRRADGKVLFPFKRLFVVAWRE
jgi:trans-aconitate 2-methyltransferase